MSIVRRASPGPEAMHNTFAEWRAMSEVLDESHITTQPLPVVRVEGEPLPTNEELTEALPNQALARIAIIASERGISLNDTATLLESIFSLFGNDLDPNQLRGRRSAIDHIAAGKPGYEVDGEGTLVVNQELTETKNILERTRESQGVAREVAAELAVHYPADKVELLSDQAKLLYQIVHTDQQQQ